MSESIQRKMDRSPEEIARLRALRERFQQEKPGIAEREGQRAEFTTLGEVIALRCLAAELKQERERQQLTLETLAQRVGLDPEMLAGIEAGLIAALNLNLLARIARALNKSIAWQLVEKVA